MKIAVERVAPNDRNIQSEDPEHMEARNAPSTAPRPKTRRRVRVTADDRDGIVAQLAHKAQSISRCHQTCALSHDDWTAEAHALLVEIVDTWFGPEGSQARTLGVTIEQYCLRRLRTRLVDRWRHLDTADRCLDTARRLDELDDLGLGDAAASHDPDPALRLDLERALLPLTPRERRLVRLCWIEGETVPAAAAILGCTEYQAAYSLKTARARLQRHLADYAP